MPDFYGFDWHSYILNSEFKMGCCKEKVLKEKTTISLSVNRQKINWFDCDIKFEHF